MQNILNTTFSVRLSILIGKSMPEKMAARLINAISSTLSAGKNFDITKSIRNNQNFISGSTLTDQELRHRSKQVLTHSGKCYYDLYHYFNKPDELNEIVPWSPEMAGLVNHSLETQGYVVVAPHLSNFDLVVARLVKGGFIGKVLSYPNPGSGYQLQNDIRKSLGMDIIPLGDSSLEADIVNYLKAGGIVATGVDRPIPNRKRRHYTKFFGKPSPLPVGYISTALAADVPIIVVAAFMRDDGSYGLRLSKPIFLQKYSNKLDEIILNAERVLQKIEEFILLSPEQWLMFYPVWPDQMTEKL